MSSRSSRKLHVSIRRVHGVSSALWPAHMRQGIATGKVAQRRRSLVAQESFGALLDTPYARHRFAMSMSSVLLIGATVVAIIMHLWAVLLISILVLMTVLTIALATQHLFLDQQPRSLHMLRPQSTQGWKSLPASRTISPAPETPMPITSPFIRVLETYDLSQTDVEHFLAPTAYSDTGEISLGEVKMGGSFEHILKGR